MGHPAGLSFSPARTDARRRGDVRDGVVFVLSSHGHFPGRRARGRSRLPDKLCKRNFPIVPPRLPPSPPVRGTVCAHTFPYASACRGLSRKPRPTLISSLYIYLLCMRGPRDTRLPPRERPPRRFNGRCRCQGGWPRDNVDRRRLHVKTRPPRADTYLGEKKLSNFCFFSGTSVAFLSLSLSLSCFAPEIFYRYGNIVLYILTQFQFIIDMFGIMSMSYIYVCNTRCCLFFFGLYIKLFLFCIKRNFMESIFMAIKHNNEAIYQICLSR